MVWQRSSGAQSCFSHWSRFYSKLVLRFSGREPRGALQLKLNAFSICFSKNGPPEANNPFTGISVCIKESIACSDRVLAEHWRKKYVYNIYQLRSSLCCSNSETVSNRNIKSISLFRICFLFFHFMHGFHAESHSEVRRALKLIEMLPPCCANRFLSCIVWLSEAFVAACPLRLGAQEGAL